MASIRDIQGKLSLKMLDSNYKNYTEELGYITTDTMVTDASSIILTDVNGGLNAVAELMDGTVVNKLVTYTVEVSN